MAESDILFSRSLQLNAVSFINNSSISPFLQCYSPLPKRGVNFGLVRIPRINSKINNIGYNLLHAHYPYCNRFNDIYNLDRSD